MQILTFAERRQIEYYTRLHRGIRDISRRLGRDHTVIGRELRRNMKDGRQYNALSAQKLADWRAKKTNKRKLTTDDRLHDYVVKRLNEDWSPEQIAGRLKERPLQFLRGKRISHEAIYQYIYDGEGRWEGLYQKLRRRHWRRHKKCGRKPQSVRIPERISVHERPDIVRVGDWETDTVQFRKQRAGLSVQYARWALLARLHKVADKSAAETLSAQRQTIESLPQYLFQTMTYDNGLEGVEHVRLRNEYNIATYFCDPYASWQKGGVENLNGLIREYLPKTTDLATVTDEEIERIQERLNNRPRKKLNYWTPNEVIAQNLILGGALNP